MLLVISHRDFYVTVLVSYLWVSRFLLGIGCLRNCLSNLEAPVIGDRLSTCSYMIKQNIFRKVNCIDEE